MATSPASKKLLSALLSGTVLLMGPIGLPSVAKAQQSPNMLNVAAQPDALGQGALDFVKSTAEKGLTFLSNPTSSHEQKKKEFKRLLDNSFDLETIGRFALGRYWNVASPAEQKEYQALFRKMVVEVYANRFNDYKGQKFEARAFRSIGNNDTLVTSYIVPSNGGTDVQVDWRVRKKNGSYKIVDVLVAGVSMSVTQRSDFSSVIQRGGGKIDVLIDHLKKGF